jgi:uncharacterized membrane protein YgcG
VAGAGAGAPASYSSVPSYSDRVGVWRNVGDVDLAASFAAYEGAFSLRFFQYLARLLLSHDSVSQQWWDRKARELPRPPAENPLLSLIDFIEEGENWDLPRPQTQQQPPPPPPPPPKGTRDDAAKAGPASSFASSSSSASSSFSFGGWGSGGGGPGGKSKRERDEALLRSAREAQYSEFVAAVELSVARRYPPTVSE